MPHVQTRRLGQLIRDVVQNPKYVLLMTLIVALWWSLNPFRVTVHSPSVVEEAPHSVSNHYDDNLVAQKESKTIENQQEEEEEEEEEKGELTVSMTGELPENLPKQQPFNCPTSRKKEKLGTNKENLIQFVHIPKAGGTSVQDTLLRIAKQNEVEVLLRDGGGPRVTINKSSLKKNTGVLLGHRGVGFSLGITPPVFYVVVMREPISRIVSLFDYVLNTKDALPPLMKELREVWESRTIDEVVTSYHEQRRKDSQSLLPGGSASLSDRHFHRILFGQLQYLCGFDCVWLISGDAREGKIDQLVDGDLILQKAKNNALNKMDCITVLHRLDDLIPCLKYHLDWVPANLKKFPHDNKVKSEKKSKLSSRSVEILRELLKDEIDLYEMVDKLSLERRQCFIK